MRSDKNILIIGCGKVGSLLTKAFHHAGYIIAGIADPSPLDSQWLTDNNIFVTDKIAALPDDAQFIIISVADDLIKTIVCEIVARNGFGESAIVAHTAGALTAEILEPVRSVNALPLAWHPLQTFTGDEDPAILRGVTFALDGDPAAVLLGRKLAAQLGGVPIEIPPEKRALYHLAAVMTSGMTCGLFGMAARLMTETGMTADQAEKALIPLLISTVQNINKNLKTAVTGPLPRGDLETIKTHLKILEKYPEVGEVYRQLSYELLKLLDDKDLEIKLKSLLKSNPL
ncbi:DUF2520 domain-containing protein [bacterium]|nr:DUF2520 domain-containing protein [bacterium]